LSDEEREREHVLNNLNNSWMNMCVVNL